MKMRRIFVACMAVLSLCLLVGFLTAIMHKSSEAGIPSTILAPSVVAAVPPTFAGMGNSSAIVMVESSSAGYTPSAIFNFGTGALTNTSSGGSLAMGGTASLTSSSGTGSIPCTNAYMVMISAGTGTVTDILVGTSSSTCTYPIYPTVSSVSLVGTGSTTYSVPVATQYYPLPQLTNVNQLCVKLVASGSTSISSADVELIYNQ